MRVLIFDETLEVIQRARSILSPLGIDLTFACSLPELALTVRKFGPHDVLIVNMASDISGWALADHIRRLPFEGRVVALIDRPDDPRRVSLEQVPRAQCVPMPRQTAQFEEALRKLVFERTAREGSEPPDNAGKPETFHGIVGRSRQMRQIFTLIEKVASGDANVCIYGESGTGKELIARAVHGVSPRAHRPFITLDCTAIPEGLMESQLFGHVKGAYTGAVDNREGVFSLAHTGTLFMDELCELNLPLQAKLLRVIQTREFSKVGSSKPVSTNLRLITATNKDLKQAVERGAFREDLYYRVAVIMIKVPSLRERRDDIPALVDYFLHKFSKVYHKPIEGITPGAMDRVVASPWPGNVRQLQNFLEQAVVLADGPVLRERDLFVTEQPALRASFGRSLEIEPGLPLREVERRYILRTLTRVHGSRTQAARMLGISLRALQYKLKAYMEEASQQEAQGGSGSAHPRLSSMEQA